MSAEPTNDTEARELLIGSPDKGEEVVVVSGRKVPHGTRGSIRWLGLGNHGEIRVGLAVPGEPKLVYTAASNVIGIWPGLSPGDDPAEGWLALWHRNQRDRVIPKVGHKVRPKSDTGEGYKVFWVSEAGDRLGYKESPDAEPEWANATDEIVRVLKDGSTQEYVPRVPARPTGDPREHGDEQSYRVDPSKVSALPYPFNAIRSVTYNALQAKASAYDEDGVFLMEIPSTSLQQFGL